ncbi:hypothetical protein [Fischerella thermalis]|uniref:hypothetical protein n=1 Tax=Fischerella thermalis TaxID=372787 RepID=UPI00307F5866
MDLQNLKWTKNIKPKGDEPWAYEQFGVGSLFKLAWRDGEANASKPQREDLILLRQKGFVTHLVKVLDYKPERETGQGEFDIYRIVEVLWAIPWNNPPVSAKADEVFGYSEVLNYQGGNVMELENIIPKHWESKGGLEAFRNHVLSQLSLV